MRHALAGVVTLFAFIMAPGVAPAQGQHEWPARLSPATRDTLTRLADSARVAGIPVAPLVAKASEGVLKGADDGRILRAVRSLTRQLGEARAVLPSAGVGTLQAAASALHAGVTPATLRRLAASAAGRDEADLGVAFVTVADLAASRVPAESAASAVEQLLRRRADVGEIAAFRAAVARDISAGREPEAALVRAAPVVPAAPPSPRP